MLSSGKYNGPYPLPWYNTVSDSLLIPQTREDDGSFEAMSMSTGKRTSIKDTPWGWWRNTIYGNAVLESFKTDSERDSNFYIFDRDNQVQLLTFKEINFPNYWGREAPKNKAEEYLRSTPEEEGRIWSYITCGNYVYYSQYTTDWEKRNFYRIKTDGTERKLLRENTNITYLVSAGSKLFCRAYHPTIKNKWDARQIDLYLLDMDGKVVEVLFSYMEDTEGNSGYGVFPYGEKLMVRYGVIYGPGYFEFLYDPATGARFPAQKG